MKLKRIFRFDPGERKFRLFRFLWKNEKSGKVGMSSVGYSGKISVAIRPVWFRRQKEFHSYRLVICGIDIHYKRSYGGVLA